MLPVAQLAAALLALAAPAGGSLPPPGLVDGATARQLQARGATVLDVRSASEFQGGHVPGALNIPHDQVASRAAEVGAKDGPVLVYCRSGRRSGLAVAELQKLGFTAVYDFKSVTAWPGALESGAAKAR